MPDSRSIRSPFLTANQPDAKRADLTACQIIRYYPGRDVSVQFGFSPSNFNTTAETRVRILLLFDGACATGGPFAGKLHGPAVAVIASQEPDSLQAVLNEQIVTLFVESRFLRETASSTVTGVTRECVTEFAEKDALIAPLVEIFRAIFQRERYPNAQYIEALGTVTAAHVLHHFFGDEALADGRGGLPAEALQRVVSYIDEHYAEEYDVDALAYASGYSRNHFQRLFKKSFEQTPRDYVRGCQVQHAITLLQTTKLKGLDVALACGFCDETQMARWFGKLRGCPPSRVREAARW